MGAHNSASNLVLDASRSVPGRDVNLSNFDLFTGSVGYAAGAGGAVTQATSKSTGVTLDKSCGAITMNAAVLNAGVAVTFTLTNSTIAATDVIVICIKSGGTVQGYRISVDSVAAGSCQITVTNVTLGSFSEAVVLNFAVIKAVIA